MRATRCPQDLARTHLISRFMRRLLLLVLLQLLRHGDGVGARVLQLLKILDPQTSEDQAGTTQDAQLLTLDYKQETGLR